jgi:topoisomerase-4 subunit A
MSHLFATTDLERSCRVNLNIIGLDHRPQVKNLAQIIKEWLTYRVDVVTRRLNFRLDKINERLHILDGLLVAYLNLDEVIRIIREDDEPKAELMTRYTLSEIQANAILDLRLRQLAKLEEIKLKTEQQALNTEKSGLEKTLGSKARLKTLVKKELLAIAKDYGDERRSPLLQVTESKAYSEEDLLTNEPVTIVLSEKGWARAAKGHDMDPQELSYRSGDKYGRSARGRTNETLVFFDTKGRAYNMAPHTLPSARGQGEPLTGRFKPPPGARFVGVAIGSADTRILMASSAGFGFVGTLADMVTKNKAGKAVLRVPGDGVALAPCVLNNLRIGKGPDTAWVAAVTDQGRMLVFSLAELPELSRGKGNKMINVPTKSFKAGEEAMISAVVLSADEELVVHAGQRHLRMKHKDLENYIGERARRGRKLPRGFQKVDGLSVG